MIYRLMFGDTYHDGHGEAVEVWISCPDKRCIEDAIKSIKDQYGDDFFKDFANDFEMPYISKNICEALYEANYNLDKLFILNECENNDWPEIKSILDIAYEDSDFPFSLSITSVVDIYIDLLNYHGALITRIGAPFDIIDSDVGYGCFG